MMIKKLFLWTIIGLVIYCGPFLILSVADAQTSPKIIGEYKSWTALKYKEKGKLVCFISSSPKKWSSTPKGVNRGDIYILVTHRPSFGTKDEVSIYVGYPFKKKSEVIAKIDGKTFRLFTDDKTAWAKDSKTDKKMVQSMRSGNQLIINGVSSRGSKTKDYYSLLGFTSAHNKINRTCK
ncbi:MAG: hypothetical protein CMM18_01865 [Rhodospirillaceae bacterium]|nr:hypothetical protein [Rhodospirillaceae bacterium]